MSVVPGTEVSLYFAIEALSDVPTALLVFVINVTPGSKLVRLSEEVVYRRRVWAAVVLPEPTVVEFSHEVNVGGAGAEVALVLSTLLAPCCTPTQTQYLILRLSQVCFLASPTAGFHARNCSSVIPMCLMMLSHVSCLSVRIRIPLNVISRVEYNLLGYLPRPIAILGHAFLCLVLLRGRSRRGHDPRSRGWRTRYSDTVPLILNDALGASLTHAWIPLDKVLERKHVEHEHDEIAVFMRSRLVPGFALFDLPRTGWKVGDRVLADFTQDHIAGRLTRGIGLTQLGGEIQGLLGEYFIFPQTGVVRIPDSLSFGEASCLPCAALAAWNALYGLTPLRPGQTVLLQGTGGVSTFALQIAHTAGARTIVTSSSDEKLENAKLLGATHVVNYRKTPDWAAEVMKITNGKGVDYIIEIDASSIS